MQRGIPLKVVFDLNRFFILFMPGFQLMFNLYMKVFKLELLKLYRWFVAAAG